MKARAARVCVARRSARAGVAASTAAADRRCRASEEVHMYLAHFYGRAAAGPSFSDRVLRTFTGTLTTVISYNNLKPYL